MGTVHVIATPIGNLEDITLRALRLLGEAELVFAEDTRRARILSDRHELGLRPVSLHAHNEESRIARALAVLEREGSVVLISDAGTPLVSDPGERLVRAVIDAGHRVEAIPGASAVLAALVVSGLPARAFTFLGFLPRRASARRAMLDSFRTRTETLVIFESPHRVTDTLREMASALGRRRGCVARELTKLHEEVVRGDLSELADAIGDETRGEFSIVVEGYDAASDTRLCDAEASEQLDRDIRTRVEAGERPREIAAALAPGSGFPKREIYARAVATREEA